MRDHPSHSKSAMLGGLWCGTSDAIPEMVDILIQQKMPHEYGQDMDFLDEIVWPIVQKSVLQHDSFSCEKFGASFPFPTPRDGWEHVGSVFIDGNMRSLDVDLLKNAHLPTACQISQRQTKELALQDTSHVAWRGRADNDLATITRSFEQHKCCLPRHMWNGSFENIDLKEDAFENTAEDFLMRKIIPYLNTSWLSERLVIGEGTYLGPIEVDPDTVLRMGGILEIEGPIAEVKLMVLSYCLYGADQRYTDGAIENAELHSLVLPGWTMRVYYDNSVPTFVLQYLRAQNVDLIDMTGSDLENKMSWRFTVASDGNVGRFCCRDIDSRLSPREKAAVDKWIDS